MKKTKELIRDLNKTIEILEGQDTLSLDHEDRKQLREVIRHGIELASILNTAVSDDSYKISIMTVIHYRELAIRTLNLFNYKLKLRI